MGLVGSLSFGFTLLLAASSCRREEALLPKEKSQPVTSTRSAPSSPAPSASQMPSPLSAEDEAVLRKVRAWNQALDRHDVETLGKLYADKVRFYGQERSKVAVMSAKRTALKKQPGFRQELIGEISLERNNGNVRATFQKKSGLPGNFLVISATLELAPHAGDFVIVEESDQASAQKEPVNGGGCEEKAAEVAHALPEAKRAITEAMQEADRSDGGSSFGGFGPNEDGEGGFSAAEGLHTDGRFEPRFVYSVDRKGRLTVMAGGQELEVPRDALKAVADACKN